jgi:hypothetical protein
MNRSLLSLTTKLAFIVFAIALVPWTSNALEISVIGPNEITVAAGELFTIDQAMTNRYETATVGTEVWVRGLSAAVATPIAGRTARFHLVEQCSASNCFGGLITVDNAFFDPDDLLVNNTGGGVSAQDPNSLLVVASLSPNISNPLVDNSGALDPGLGGALDEPSDRDVTLDLVANAIGTHIFSITGEYADGTDILSFQQDASFIVQRGV